MSVTYLKSGQIINLHYIKRVSDTDTAKDILQDVLLKSYLFCSSGRRVTYLRPWLYKITHHAIIEFHRISNRNLTSEKDWLQVHEHTLIGEASEYVRHC